jgi:flagellar protein FliO/FliZ
MQMLESLFGAQGARYAGFVLAALAILLLVVILWWLIRKAMGGRLNMSDRPDRRGRPPRLGITESFAVDRQGRRLVMVRRDNVEHLVMIGGPNDVVIETNVVRGERPMVGRPDARGAEPEVIPTLALSDIAPSPAPTPMPAPPLAKPSTPLPPPKPVEPPPIKVVEPTLPPKPAPAPLAPPVTPPAPPVAAPPKPPVVEPVPPPTPPAAPVEGPPPAPAKSGMSLVERIKAGLPMGKPSPEPAKAAAAEAPAQARPAIVEDIKTRIEGVAKTSSSPPKPDEMKAALEEAVKNETAKAAAKAPDMRAAEAKAAEIKAKIEEAVKPAAPPPPPVTPPPPSPPSPAPAAAPPPPAPAAPPAQATAAPAAKPASKNPFDSLEEEMAKLLGRAPDGKG